LENQSQGPVDIDNMKIKVLFVVKNKQNFESTISFLIRRGWEAAVTTSTKEAFKLISVFKPDFILLSVNFKTPKINQLPSVLYQTFKTDVVIFGESSDTKTLGLMQNIVANHKMPGTVSGPSIQRRIKQILQEIYAPTAGAVTGEENTKGQQSETVVVQGKKNQKTMYTFTNTEKSKDNTPGVYIAKGEKSKMGEGYNPYSSEELDQNEGHDGNEGRKAHLQSATQSANNQNHKDFELSDDIAALAAQFTEEDNTDADDADEIKKSDVSIELDENHTAKSTENKSDDSEFVSPTDSKGNREQNTSSKLLQENSVAPKNFQDIEFEHMMIRLAKKSVVGSEAAVREQSSYEQANILPIKLNGEAGFLLAAFSGLKKDFLQFNLRFENAIAEFCEAKTIPLEKQASIEIVVEDVNLLAKTPGEIFTTELFTGQCKVLIKFIKAAGYLPTLEVNDAMEKAEIHAAELVSNLSAGVDIYIHMPKNEKYQLYFKSQSLVSEKQKTKLIESDVAVCINKEDIETFKEFYTRNKTIEVIRELKLKLKAAG